MGEREIRTTLKEVTQILKRKKKKCPQSDHEGTNRTWLEGQGTKATNISWKVFSRRHRSFHQRPRQEGPFSYLCSVPGLNWSWSVSIALTPRPKEELDILFSLRINGYRRKSKRHFAKEAAKRIKEMCITWLFPTVNKERNSVRDGWCQTFFNTWYVSKVLAGVLRKTEHSFEHVQYPLGKCFLCCFQDCVKHMVHFY